MLVKILDLIFPIAKLPEDKVIRDIVIEKYEESIENAMNYSKKSTLILSELVLILFFAVVPLTYGFSIFNIKIFLILLFLSLLYFISIIIKYKNISNLKLVLFSNIFLAAACFFNFLIMNIAAFKNSLFDWNTNSDIYIISIICYYAGYWYYLKTFNKRMITFKKRYHVAGSSALLGTIGYIVCSRLPLWSFEPLCIWGIFFISFGISIALVNYRQYDNIQNAKNGLPFK